MKQAAVRARPICGAPSMMALVGGAFGGIGAAVSTAVGAARYPFNGVFDVYRIATHPLRVAPALR